MQHFEYIPTGVCSRYITFDLDEEHRIHNLQYMGGCNGNLKAVAKLLEGEKAEVAIEKLEGNTCGPRPTSCADQLTKALRKALEQ